MLDKGWKNVFFDWLKAAFFAVLLAAFLRNFIFLPIGIEGSSMMPTLEQNDQIIVETIYNLERFDLVVFRGASDQMLVKRVIGLPGEEVWYENGQLYINDQPVNEPFLQNELVANAGGQWTSDFTLEELTGQPAVPANEYFVLGDNRRLSNDSRYFGTISADSIMGETSFIYYPFSRLSFVR